MTLKAIFNFNTLKGQFEMKTEKRTQAMEGKFLKYLFIGIAYHKDLADGTGWEESFQEEVNHALEGLDVISVTTISDGCAIVYKDN